ncbi:hypothetical protein BH09PSE2_BH09PSE2_24500 [soil metagenome]
MGSFVGAAALTFALLVGASGSPAAASPAPAVASLSDGVWLKGDLHIHSRHSKDSSNNPVRKIIALAEDVGMGFLLISDHDNHVDGDVAHHTWADAEYTSKSMVLLYGAEWTTARGHATALAARPYGHKAFYDVRDRRDVRIGEEKKRLGIHLSANHPGSKDSFGFSYDIVDSIEVWQSAVWKNNAQHLHIWDQMLKSGRKLTGRGGSDSHHGYPDTPEQKTDLSYQARENNVGTPTTWVFAREKTGDAVVAALTNGRVSISANPYAPRVELTADVDGDGRPDLMMGDDVQASGCPVAFRVALSGPMQSGPYTVRVIRNGAPFASLAIQAPASSATFTATPPAVGRS